MAIRMFSTLTQQRFYRLIHLFIYLFEPFLISNPSIHPACWLPRLQSLLVTLNFKWLQFSPWWHGEVPGSASGRVVLDMLPAAGVLLERRERDERGGRGEVLEHHASSDVFFLFFMIILETAFSFEAMWHGWLFHLCFWLGLLMVGLPWPVKLPLAPPPSHPLSQCSVCAMQHWKNSICNCCCHFAPNRVMLRMDVLMKFRNVII